jgi:hypothetical protein
MSKLKKITLELLSNPIFHFTNKDEINYDYFPTYIKSLLDQYSSCIRNPEFWEEFLKIHYFEKEFKDQYLFVNMIVGLCLELNECINAYYLGQLNKAFNHLKSGLNEKGVLYGTSELFKEAIKRIDQETLELYRIRVKKSGLNIEFNRGEMFHIPFENRGIVTTQRYSIPGHPSLYLGDSIFSCWEEMNQPPIKKVYASRFLNSTDLNIIEIIRTQDLIKKIEPLEGQDLSSEIFRFLLTFPLTIVCSIKVKNQFNTFKPEYIIPQLFCQFILETQTEIDGIKYFSTKIDHEKVENVNTYNYIFPTKTNSEKGYCKTLSNKFKLTHPILWEYEEINTGNSVFLYNKTNSNARIELYKGRKVPYDWTTFKAIEKVLSFPSMILEDVYK